MSLHAFYDFVGHSQQKYEPEPHDEAEYQSQLQWKRDFEEEDEGFIGDMRERIREAKRDARVLNGLTVTARNLYYIAPRQNTRLQTVPIIIERLLFFLPRLVKQHMKSEQGNRKNILSDLNFTIREKTMTLLLGSPGSGKSSLCRLLANQDIEGKVEGELLFGGEPIHESDHHHRVAFVRDADIHLAHLTVKQTFQFADTLLNPRYPKEQQERKIAAIMQILGLSHRADTIVGNDLVRGVSGGERRRVSIGVELMKRCQLLVLDEATTGLDSTTSLQIFRALRIIADEVSPVFATLKQPGRELFELFDQLILLHEGHIMYVGPTNSVIDHFEQAGYELDREVNPADEVLTFLDKHGDELLEKMKSGSLSALSHSSTSGSDIIHTNNDDDIDIPLKDNENRGNNNNKSAGTLDEYHNNFQDDSISNYGNQIRYSKYNRSWPTQFLWSVIRSAQEFKNNPGIAMFRIVFAIIVALIVGTLFLQIDNSQSGIQATSGAIFIVATFSAFQALSGLPTTFAVRDVFYYQKQNRYFHPIPAILADVVTSLPVAIVESIVFATICYWMVGFNTHFDRFVYFILMVVVLELTFQFGTKAVGYLVPSFLVANIFIPPIVFGLNFFTGFTITYDRAPVYMQWIFWVTPFRYLFEGLTINEFLGRDLECEDDEFLPPRDDPLFDQPYSAGGYEGVQLCPITQGEQVLDRSGFHTDVGYKWYWFLVLIGYLLGAFILVLLAATFVQHDPPVPRNLEQAEKEREKQKRRIRRLTESVVPSLALNDSNEHGNSEDSGSDNANNNGQDEHAARRGLIISKEGRRLETNVPIYLEWRNVCYYVPIAPKPKNAKDKLVNTLCSRFVQEDLQLLDNVNGYAKPGMLIAFMGPSGAGKTTLLDVLAQRKTAGRVEGDILINGAPLDPKVLSRFAGYVEQQNIHVDTETVEESLGMSAALRLSFVKEHNRKITRTERLEHVNWVMNTLGLMPIRHAMVQELSLEQKKRLTIGVELAANPSLLFLDEPTSGLDSIAAARIMKSVKAIADSGVSVVCTLHQPSEILFSWCTHLLLLARGGKVTYFGELTDNCESAVDYFEKFGFRLEEKRNPADFFLDCCSSDKKNSEGQSVVEAYQESQGAYEVRELLESGVVPRQETPDSRSLPRKFLNLLHIGVQENPNASTELVSKSEPQHNEKVSVPEYDGEYARNPVFQWLYLTTRSFRYWWRSPVAMILMIIRSTLFGVILGLLFSEFDNSQIGASERIGVIFFIVLVLSSSALSFVPQLFQERAVFYRETSAKTYREGAYLFSLVASALPIIFLSSMLALIPIWAITDLQKGWIQIGYFFGVGNMIALIPYGFALFLCSLAPNPEAGNGMVSIINIINAFTAGFLLLPSDIPPYWIWAYWVAYLHYALEGLILNEFIGINFYCRNNEGAIPVPVPSETDPLRVQFYCPIRDGANYVVENLDLYRPGMPIDISVLIGFFVLLLLLAWLTLANVRHIKR